jgi:hypothetical protein
MHKTVEYKKIAAKFWRNTPARSDAIGNFY